MYRLPETTFSHDNKADIVTTQCEAYEVLKLQEIPQGHTHTDVEQEEAYVDVGEEGLVSDRPSAQASRPQQETTTEQMYEEVAHP